MSDIIRAKIVQPQLKARIGRSVVRTKIADTATITSTTHIHTGGGSIGVQFTAAEIISGSVSIGSVQTGARIDRVALIVDEAFDGAAQFTVGDDGAPARLMAPAQNAPGVVGRYTTDADYEYTVETDVKLYLAAGMPFVGAGQVVIYF